MLSARGLSKTYTRRGRLGAGGTAVPALQSVDLDIWGGRTLGIAGLSGSGKSTLARCLAGLEQPDAGEILLDGRRLEIAGLHRRVQVIFQDPGASLNPRFSVTQALEEPLSIRGRRDSPHRIVERLRQVGLSESSAVQSSSELSGGERARLAIARALAALEGESGECVLILDESLASLDLKLRTQITELLQSLQRERQVALVFIAHDLSLVAQLCDHMAFLWQGCIVQQGTANELFGNPQHPKLRELVEATVMLEKGHSTAEW